MTLDDWLAKVEYEGGLEAAFDYGLSVEDLDEGTDLGIITLLYRTRDAYVQYQAWRSEANQRLRDLGKNTIY